MRKKPKEKMMSDKAKDFFEPFKAGWMSRRELMAGAPALKKPPRRARHDVDLRHP
jgi:hypothetical protein